MPVYIDAVFSSERSLGTDPLLQWVYDGHGSALSLDGCTNLALLIRSILAQDLNNLFHLFQDWLSLQENPQQLVAKLSLDQNTRKPLNIFFNHLDDGTKAICIAVLQQFRSEIATRIDYAQVYRHQKGQNQLELLHECQRFQAKLQEIRTLTSDQRPVAVLYLCHLEYLNIEQRRRYLMRGVHYDNNLNTRRQKILRLLQVILPNLQPLTLDASAQAYNNIQPLLRQPLCSDSQPLLNRILLAEKTHLLAAATPKKIAAQLAFDNVVNRPCLAIVWDNHQAILFMGENEANYTLINQYFRLSANGAIVAYRAEQGSEFNETNLDINALNHCLRLRRLCERGTYRNADKNQEEQEHLSMLECAVLQQNHGLSQLNPYWFTEAAYPLLQLLPMTILQSGHIEALNALIADSPTITTLQQRLLANTFLPVLSEKRRHLIHQLIEAEKDYADNLSQQSSQKAAGILAFGSDIASAKDFISVGEGEAYITKDWGDISLNEINTRIFVSGSHHVYARDIRYGLHRHPNRVGNDLLSPHTRQPLRLTNFNAQNLDLVKLNQLLQLRRLQEHADLFSQDEFLRVVNSLAPFMKALLQLDFIDFIDSELLKDHWFKMPAYGCLQTINVFALTPEKVRQLNALPDAILANISDLQRELERLNLLPLTLQMSTPSRASQFIQRLTGLGSAHTFSPAARGIDHAAVIQPVLQPTARPTPTVRPTVQRTTDQPRNTSTPVPQSAPSLPPQPMFNLTLIQRQMITQLIAAEKTYADNLSQQSPQKLAGILAFGHDSIRLRDFMAVTSGTDAYLTKTSGNISLAEIDQCLCVSGSGHMYSWEIRSDLHAHPQSRNDVLSPESRQPFRAAHINTQNLDLAKLNVLLQLRRLHEQPNLEPVQVFAMTSSLPPFMQALLRSGHRLNPRWFAGVPYEVLQTLPLLTLTADMVERMNALPDEAFQNTASLQQALALFIPLPPVASVNTRIASQTLTSLNSNRLTDFLTAYRGFYQGDALRAFTAKLGLVNIPNPNDIPASGSERLSVLHECAAVFRQCLRYVEQKLITYTEQLVLSGIFHVARWNKTPQQIIAARAYYEEQRATLRNLLSLLNLELNSAAIGNTLVRVNAHQSTALGF